MIRRIKSFVLRSALVLVGAGLAVGVAGAQVYVHVGPPRARIERRPPPPRPGYVWREGYHRWDGRAYVWVPGEYIAPPRPHAYWVPGRWVRTPRGWYYREGHWR